LWSSLPWPMRSSATESFMPLSGRRAIDNFRFRFMRHFKWSGGCGKRARIPR
jgi:hypothetical protein